MTAIKNKPIKETKIFCAGLIGWDTIGTTKLPMKIEDDLPGSINTTVGGVIANIASELALNGQKMISLEVILLSSTGSDRKSDLLLSSLSKKNKVNCNHIIRQKGASDGYIGIEVEGKLFGAISSSKQLEKACKKIFEPLVENKKIREEAPFKNYLVIDSNLTNETINYLCTDPFYKKTPFVIACASPFKAKRIRPLILKRRCIIYANLLEASEILGKKFICSSEAATSLYDLGAEQAIVTDGGNKTSIMSTNGIIAHFPPPTAILKTTGAGDSFLAAHFLSKITNKELTEQAHLEFAHNAALKKINREETI